MSKENSHSNTTVKTILKRYWWILLICLISPIAINYALLIPAFGPVVGTNIDWLAFFGSYIAAIIPALGSFIILFIQRKDNHEENKQNRQLQINVLKYQQEMQWLSEKKEILIDFALTLNKNDLIELSNKIAAKQDILQDVKRLLEKLVKHDSRVGFMTVSAQTDKYKEYNEKRNETFNTFRNTLLDLQEINIIFNIPDYNQRGAILNIRLEQGFIHSGLKDIIAQFPYPGAFLLTNPSEVALMLISSIPDLLEDTRKAALDYVKSEADRIASLVE